MRSTGSARAVSAWFFLNGFVIAAWIAHVPRLKDALQTTPGPLGLALLCPALGAVLGMSAAPSLAGRFGAGRAAWVAGLLLALLVPLPIGTTSVVGLGLALLVLGVANGVMEVMMNTAAAAAELAAGRPIMSAFHGWFSVGMVAGSLGAVAALSAGLHPLAHAGLVVAFVAVLLLGSRPTIATEVPAEAEAPASGWAFRDRHVLALAALAFVCMFLEGGIADWSGLLAAGYGADTATASLAYVAFTATWATGRFAGNRLTRAFGDVPLSRLGGVLAAGGMTFAVLSESPLGVAVGSAVVGLGLANVVPILFRAGAATDPTGRGAGLAVVTSIGYAGFMVGPVAIGFLAEAVGLPRAMLLYVLGGVVLTLGAGVLRARNG